MFSRSVLALFSPSNPADASGNCKRLKIALPLAFAYWRFNTFSASLSAQRSASLFL
jgi:hypothetical protein